jgi:UPF0271 protein
LSRKIFVLDTSAVIAGFLPGLAEVDQITVEEVLDEAKTLSPKLGLEAAMASGKLRIAEPSQTSISAIEDQVKVTGDTVSDVDVKVLALALDMKREGKDPEVVTDDYAIQNLASFFGIKYRRIAMPGITRELMWEKICPACKIVYPAPSSKCEVCGLPLLRRPKGEVKKLKKEK